MPKPKTVDQYIDATPEPGRALIEGIRAVCRDAAPSANEALKWGHPAYVHADGTILFMFSGHKAHASLAFTPSTKAAFERDLAAYKTGKGTFALPYGSPLPEELLRRMIEFRIREYEVGGVRWM